MIKMLNLVISKKQAKIVKRIYTEFLNGKGTKLEWYT